MIRINNTNYVALRIDKGYMVGTQMIRDMYCIMGQREDTLNWDFLERCISSEEGALKTCKNLKGSADIDIFDIGGYAVQDLAYFF